MSEYHGEPLPTIGDIFRNAHAGYKEGEPEIVVRYLHLNKQCNADRHATSHHLFRLLPFFAPKKYSYSNLESYDFAYLRRDHQEEDLWNIFKRHSFRAFLLSHDIGYRRAHDLDYQKHIDPYKELNAIQPEHVGLRLSSASDRTLPLSVRHHSELIDPIAVKNVEDRVRQQIKPWKMFF